MTEIFLAIFYSNMAWISVFPNTNIAGISALPKLNILAFSYFLTQPLLEYLLKIWYAFWRFPTEGEVEFLTEIWHAFPSLNMACACVFFN